MTNSIIAEGTITEVTIRKGAYTRLKLKLNDSQSIYCILPEKVLMQLLEIYPKEQRIRVYGTIGLFVGDFDIDTITRVED